MDDPGNWAPLGEEIANSVSHGVGLILALAAIPFLLAAAARRGDAGTLVGTVLFSISVTLLYLASTLFHALPPGAGKGVFQVIEHAAIYVLIAGTYSPFTLGVLRGTVGWTLFALVWGVAVAGTVLKAVNGLAHPALSTALYLAMGWVAIGALPAVLTKVPRRGVLWLVAGGLAYSVGVIFFVLDDRLAYGHLVWHLFVILGTACHFAAVHGYAARPRPHSHSMVAGGLPEMS